MIADLPSTRAAEAGQIVMSQRAFERLSGPPGEARPASLELKGKRETEPARVLDLGSAPVAAQVAAD